MTMLNDSVLWCLLPQVPEDIGTIEVDYYLKKCRSLQICPFLVHEKKISGRKKSSKMGTVSKSVTLYLNDMNPGNKIMILPKQ